MIYLHAREQLKSVSFSVAFEYISFACKTIAQHNSSSLIFVMHSNAELIRMDITIDKLCHTCMNTLSRGERSMS
jgi:hypothetical protein